ncbi:hypothetical protein ACFQ0O_17540 [Saccharopolyspora spinosporotrichia]|uniref:Uncharacterized protein n=1 Tax=Saccharopolyspora erythraea (strain ATCC 11635 / DSM 40517 / JCM 4748 / NBRC 13426 / NCIMB 8594 / NRRL 2338) TaxID=405948 RepID=A4FFR0_SACEN|nr:hypothetical protein JQX30_18435 [Saccharopolyspora erythraea]CAM02885.1 hypothetical protein SACE_3611 [Saccharopolyspora erythraea NRRL 2338]
MTTRIVGELSLDEAGVPARPEAPRQPPPPNRVEVTQPYIPAIRDEQPEFAKKLSPERPSTVGASGLVTDPVPAVAPPPAAGQTSPTPESAPAPVPAVPAPPQGLATTAGAPAPTAPAAPAKPGVPVKRRSLVRRVVRKIIGPDLLRKDPPKKRR